MKTFSLFLLVILISSCSFFKQERIYGEYRWSSFFDVGATITINKDNSFVYDWQQGLLWGTTEGEWKLEGNNLILNSKKQPKIEEKFKVIKNGFIPKVRLRSILKA